MAKNFLLQILTRIIPLAAYVALMLFRQEHNDLSDVGQHGALTVVFTLASLLASGLTYKLMTHVNILENIFTYLIFFVVVVAYSFAIINILIMMVSGTQNIFNNIAPVLIASSGLVQGVFSNYYAKIDRHEILFWINVLSVMFGMFFANLLKLHLPVLPAFLVIQSQVAFLLFIITKTIKPIRLRFRLMVSLITKGRWFLIFSSGDVLFNLFFIIFFITYIIKYSINF